MACDSSSGIAAFADISGVMLKSLASYYIPIQPVPYLKIHGTADNEILYNGNSYYYSVDYVINFWKNNNNINSLKDSIVLPDIDTSDNSTVIKYTYGEDSSEIVFYKIINGGHDIPDWCLNNEMGNTNRDINTPVVLWDFFKKHRYKEKETILNSYRINQTSNFKTYPNPAQNILKVEYPGLQQKEVVYKIIDLTGKILQQGELAGNIVDVSKLSKGKYLLSINFENETTSEKIIIE